MRKFTTRIYQSQLSAQPRPYGIVQSARRFLHFGRRQDHYRRSFGCAAPGGSDPHLQRYGHPPHH